MDEFVIEKYIEINVVSGPKGLRYRPNCKQSTVQHQCTVGSFKWTIFVKRLRDLDHGGFGIPVPKNGKEQSVQSVRSVQSVQSV